MRSKFFAIRRRLFSDPDQREAIWAEVDAAMDDLGAALEDLINPGVGEEEALKGFEAAAEHEFGGLSCRGCGAAAPLSASVVAAAD